MERVARFHSSMKTMLNETGRKTVMTPLFPCFIGNSIVMGWSGQQTRPPPLCAVTARYGTGQDMYLVGRRHHPFLDRHACSRASTQYSSCEGAEGSCLLISIDCYGQFDSCRYALRSSIGFGLMIG